MALWDKGQSSQPWSLHFMKEVVMTQLDHEAQESQAHLHHHTALGSGLAHSLA